ncbi:hypothetical protein CGCSCA1_v012762 [Colletotrichum siamense]|nr:hypothetical protein CGCSCA1_v012762 [Colletotrichum siamense]
MKDENKGHLKATCWRLEQLELKVNRFVISIEDTAALPIDWNSMTGQM